MYELTTKKTFFFKIVLYFNLIIKRYSKIEIYEYGNGIYAPPFWDRVQTKIDKIKENYIIVDSVSKFIPRHYVQKNCCGMDTYRADELFLTLFVKKK